MANLTSSKVAGMLGVAHSTVRSWCNRNLFPSAAYIETPAGGYWQIPEEDLKNFTPPKPGRPRKSQPQEEKAA